MKKIISVVVLILSVFTSVFTQDFASEADDLLLIEENKAKNDFSVGFDVSVLGIEPTFQWIHNDHLEMMGGISFIQYGSGFIYYDNPQVFLITPIYDIGYRTNFYFPDSHFSVGATSACSLGILSDGFGLIGALAIYIRGSKNFGIFEIGGKTYVPLWVWGHQFGGNNDSESIPVFSNFYSIAAGLIFTSIEVKIHIN